MGNKRGHLVIIGGAEDRRDDKLVLGQVSELAGGDKGHMVVLTTEVGRGEALAVTDVHLHMLPAGFAFDLASGVESSRQKGPERLRALMATMAATE